MHNTSGATRLPRQGERIALKCFSAGIGPLRSKARQTAGVLHDATMLCVARIESVVLMTSRIAIHGQGIAACCCAMLLREERASIVPVGTSRPRLPAVLISDGSQALLREIFKNEKLFAGLPTIRRRVVAWNGGKIEPFPHSVVVAGEQAIGERLQGPVPAWPADRPDGVEWNIFTS